MAEETGGTGQQSTDKGGFGARVKKTIGELMVAEGLIKEEQIEEALSLQKKDGKKIVQTLIDLGHIDVVTFAKFLASRRSIPSINLSNYQIQPELCALIPREFAIENDIFPIDKMGKLLTVGMASPLGTETIDQLKEMSGLKVKGVLCSREHIHNAIQRYYAEPEKSPGESGLRRQVETAIKLENIADIIRKIDALPTLPKTVAQVQQASEDPDTSIKYVADIVSFDPPIAAKLLQMANSAAYGLPTLVDSVPMAVKLLGLDEVYRIVLSSAVIDLVEKSSHFDHKKFWETSRFCALAAKNISNTSTLTPMPGLFTSGLLLDIGRFALTEIVPKRYEHVAQESLGNSLANTEESTLGIAHPEVGYLLATHWGFPEEIATAIRFHHTPELAAEAQDEVPVVALAAHMTDAHDRGQEPGEQLFAACGQTLAAARLDTQAALRAYADTIATCAGNRD